MKFRTLLIAAASALLTSGVIAMAQLAQPGVNSNLAQVWTLMWEYTTNKPTFSATAQGVPPAVAQDVCTIGGSATKTIRVRRVVLQGMANAQVSDPVLFLTRSTLDTGAGFRMIGGGYDNQGSSLTPTESQIEFWTAVPTAGTLIAELAEPIMNWGNLTTGAGTSFSYDFSTGGAGSVILRGAAQSLSVHLLGLTYTTPVLNCTFVWTEE